MRSCIKCQTSLDNSNWKSSNQKKKYYICNKCFNAISTNIVRVRRNDPAKMAIIYASESKCSACFTKLTKENWGRDKAAKRHCICIECNKKIKNSENKKSKEDAIAAYGGSCTCCGISNIVFLTIDHISNNGSRERKLLNVKTGSSTYRYLKRQGYPKNNYQILCFNCNFAKHLLGVCPHQNHVQ